MIKKKILLSFALSLLAFSAFPQQVNIASIDSIVVNGINTPFEDISAGLIDHVYGFPDRQFLPKPEP